MTKEQLAAKLNGRDYGEEISEAEELEAKAAGLIVIFGYSDDNVELRGVINDEVSCYNGTTLKLHSRDVLDSHEERCGCDFCGYESIAKKCATVQALWCKEPGYSWTYKTEVPHATFDIIDCDEKYCRGIVLEASALPVL